MHWQQLTKLGRAAKSGKAAPKPNQPQKFWPIKSEHKLTRPIHTQHIQGKEP